MNHPPESGVTIQINNLAALERLLGADSELTTSIRSSVAEAFAKKHMVNLVEREFSQKEAAMKQLVAEEVARYCLQKTRDSTSWAPIVELTPSVKEKIKLEVSTQLGMVMAGEIARQKAEVTAALVKELETLRACIPNLVTERVTVKFNKEVTDALDARLKELRNLLPADPPESRKITVP